MRKLIAFDLDGTLAESKSALDTEMSTLLGELLRVVRVAVISGGGWPQFEKQLLSGLPHDGRLDNLSLLPTCGTKFFRHADGWRPLYSEDLTEGERASIKASLADAVAQSGFATTQTWGATIEDRGSQITFSALGQEAPIAEKKRWDPDFSKRRAITAVLDTRLPNYSVRMGGTTSIDVTRRGIDKAYGIEKLRDTIGVAMDEMIFIGDALFPGGNDHPARRTGVTCIQVRDPDETKRVIEAIVACLGPQGRR